MSSFVLDCSVTMAWCFPSQADAYTGKVLSTLSRDTAVVPGVWTYEVANALLVALRRGLITRPESVNFLDSLNQFSISTIEDQKKSWKDLLFWMGKSHDLSAYDTAYLYLAMNYLLPLATRDKKLAHAAKLAKVPLYQP